ncbi:MAG TPA: glycosyltransferase family 4 protein [Phycisphaerae bacterium]|nr:glycosyltransferase family 4 protein [Phycisphaerae bacterium]
MKIALVHPFFLPGLGYEATGWFHAFRGLGHAVRVFTSPYAPQSLRCVYEQNLSEGVELFDGGEVHRLHAWLGPRRIVTCPGLTEALRGFRPDLTIIHEPASLFPTRLIKEWATVGGGLMCMTEQNHAQRRTTLPRPLEMLRNLLLEAGFFVLKRSAVRRCMEASDAVLFVTPDTYDFVLPRVASGGRRELLLRKCFLVPYGFDSAAFLVDEEGRSAERRRLGIADDEVVALHSCRMTPVKRLDIWVSVVSRAMRRVPRLKAMLIGLRKGDAESDRILSLITRSDLKERFIYLPFANRETLARLYNAADFGIWHLQPSITIQEAMGTGLYMVLVNDATISHLVLEPQTGRYFEPGNYAQLEERIVNAAGFLIGERIVSKLEARRCRAAINAHRFSYRSLAERIVAAAQDPANAEMHLRTQEVGETLPPGSMRAFAAGEVLPSQVGTPDGGKCDYASA